MVLSLYGHPKISTDHTIRAGIFDCDGTLHFPDGTEMNVNMYDKNTEINLSELSVVYDSPEGETVRLLSVSPTLPLRVGLASFVLNDAACCTIRQALKTGNGLYPLPLQRQEIFLLLIRQTARRHTSQE